MTLFAPYLKKKAKKVKKSLVVPKKLLTFAPANQK
jgi:hypothetical protein